MFKIETENLILRDMVEADIEKHMRWFTTCFFAIVFPENLQQNSNKFADGIPWNLHLQIYNFIGRSSMHA